MATVVVARVAQIQLRWLMSTRALPADTPIRLAPLLDRLARYPLMGKELHGPHSRSRVLRGPWDWMVVVYNVDLAADRVEIIAIQDARTADAWTAER